MLHISAPSSKFYKSPFNPHVLRPVRLQIPARASASHFSLQGPSEKLSYTVSKVTVGAGQGVELRVNHPNVAAVHACLEQRGGRVYCTALSGDEADFLSDTHCWLDGTQLRKGVSYLIEPGARLAFGTPESEYTVAYEQQAGSTAMMETLMKGMASQGSEEVRRALQDL